MKTLFVMPHLDDESISCGGLVQARLKQGHDLSFLFIYGRTYDYGKTNDISAEIADMNKALDVLGYAGSSVGVASRTEGEPHQVGYYGVLNTLEPWISEFKPDEVVGPSSSDLNQDHRMLSHVLDIALRSVNLAKVTRRMEFLALDGTTQEPNCFLRMTDAMILRKQKAVSCYHRESRTGTSPRSPENLLAQARVWGAKAGYPMAEAYRIKMLREEV